MTVNWKNRSLKNWDEALSAALKVAPHEAEAFLMAFETAGCKPEVALSNIGYWTGYHAWDKGNEMLRTLRSTFGDRAQHPVFGAEIPSDPAVALAAGMAIAEKLKKAPSPPEPEEFKPTRIVEI
jgi:hypothetical protein